MTNDETKKAIEELAKKANTMEKSDDALKFSQVALLILCGRSSNAVQHEVAQDQPGHTASAGSSIAPGVQEKRNG